MTQMHMVVASASGIEAAALRDPELVRRAVLAGCEAGGLRVLELVVRPFEPQGVTACAILADLIR